MIKEATISYNKTSLSLAHSLLLLCRHAQVSCLPFRIRNISTMSLRITKDVGTSRNTDLISSHDVGEDIQRPSNLFGLSSGLARTYQDTETRSAVVKSFSDVIPSFISLKRTLNMDTLCDHNFSLLPIC
ncbi:hypothetical protein SERLA73DRAFT_174482 [Serpula lacrymans var. lacrymans S7.3]|uniref:Uncharacterized protein n=2 Tax=Serpula lacrymans var. lacrymans TaxID=341189 RepID=F8PG25_SERL3|nr:uncharacterized protein SERLADRAFT_456019 [Serpula lacrymans var. lacrymans S7.9]EGO05360.1 hypothetical protein SERLA73DRAFT_174482 [Serpula lacrymans var. lacrymans S7.3]EGO31211.1 hypothetical protein SERLADRAFT_456019 [Serpula lacrymans var. lacrymans S7.9]